MPPFLYLSFDFMNRNFSLYSFLILLMLSACAKEKDLQAPKIRIQSPLNSTSYTVPFQLSVVATISDDVGLDYYQIKISGPDGQVVQSLQINTNEKEKQVNEVFTMSDIHLASGIYTINVKASDGNHLSSKYVQINVSGINRVLEKVFISSKQNNQGKLKYIAGNSLTDFYAILNEPSFFLINSYYQKIALAEKAGNPIQILNAQNGSVEQNIVNVTSQANYFTATHYSTINHSLLIGTSDQKIKVFNSGGDFLYQFSVSNGFQAEQIYHFEDVILVAEKSQTTTNKKLSCYNYNSGNMLFSNSINFDHIVLLGEFNHQPLFWVNTGSNGEVKSIHKNSGAITTLYNFGQAIIQVRTIHSGYYLILLTNGIYLYNSTSNTINQIINSNQLIDFQYDNISEIIYAMSLTDVRAYLAANGTLINQVSSSDTLVSIQLLYNK